MKTFTIILVLFSFLISCGETYEMGALFVQKIPNSSKVIYHYSAASKINDSYKVGYTLMDSTQEIVISKIKDLPISLISEKPSSELIKGIKFIAKSKENSALSEEQINIEGIRIKIKEIPSLNNNSQKACFNEFYKFKSFKETQDKIILSEIYKENTVRGEKLKSIAFPKGNIKLWASKNSIVTKIEIDKLILASSGVILCKKKYIFEPQKSILLDSFSNFGIFKQKQ
jgi:hypothetical protein